MKGEGFDASAEGEASGIVGIARLPGRADAGPGDDGRARMGGLVTALPAVATCVAVPVSAQFPVAGRSTTTLPSGAVG
ncbi:hypothetical protein [Sphingomonas gellani]|uniref:hypothetical protein n=1 Tax=Sphingomonas gellani TaxID=1166340 RepID=UPI000B81BDCD|nr:hypothetical protein [Sphingomonas gellani]